MTKSSPARRLRKQRKEAQPVSRDSNSIAIMSYDKSKAKRPFSAPPIPDDFCGWIGKLAITWAMVELAIDDFIRAFHSVLYAPPRSNWERGNFKRRKELCRDMFKSVCANCPSFEQEVRSILADAADLHWRRNTLLHGRLKSKLWVVDPAADPVRIKASLTATTRHNGQPVALTFDTAGVEDLFYKIANVAGRLTTLATPDSGVPGASSPDTVWWRDFLVSNHPNLPTPNKS
jgi:hypothetical protein